MTSPCSRDSERPADPPVRLAQPADAEDIAIMSRELIERGLPWNWRPARVLRAIRDPDTNVAVVRMDGVLVGFGIMEYRDADASWHCWPYAQRTGEGASAAHCCAGLRHRPAQQELGASG